MAYGFYSDIVAALKSEAGADDHRGAGGLCRDAAAEIERLRAIVADACEVLRHYDLPEHAFHYERVLAGKVPLTVEQEGDKS